MKEMIQSNNIFAFDGLKFSGPYQREDLANTSFKRFWFPGLHKWITIDELDNALELAKSNKLLEERNFIPGLDKIAVFYFPEKAWIEGINIASLAINSQSSLVETLKLAVATFKLHLDQIGLTENAKSLITIAFTQFIKDIYGNNINSKLSKLNSEEILYVNKLKSFMKENINNKFDIIYDIENCSVSDLILMKEFSTKFEENEIIYLYKKGLILDNLFINYFLIKGIEIVDIKSFKLNSTDDFNFNNNYKLLSNKYKSIINSIDSKRTIKILTLNLLLHCFIYLITILNIKLISNEYLNNDETWPFTTFFRCDDIYWETVNNKRLECFNGIFYNYDTHEVYLYGLLPLILFIGFRYILKPLITAVLRNAGNEAN